VQDRCFLHSSPLPTSHPVLGLEKPSLNMCHGLRSTVSSPPSTKFSLQMLLEVVLRSLPNLKELTVFTASLSPVEDQ